MTLRTFETAIYKLQFCACISKYVFYYFCSVTEDNTTKLSIHDFCGTCIRVFHVVLLCALITLKQTIFLQNRYVVVKCTINCMFFVYLSHLDGRVFFYPLWVDIVISFILNL